MAIKRGTEVKLNIRPIFIGFIHLHVFEGPCRFGKGDELTEEFDRMTHQDLYRSFCQSVETNLSDPAFNVMDPIYVERYEDFITKDQLIEDMAKDIGKADIALFFVGIARHEVVVEFAQRHKIPVAIMPGICCATAETITALRARNLESYGYLDWPDAIRHLKALRVRKVLRDTSVLLAPRLNATNSVASGSSFINLSQVTQLFGTRFRYVNAHELLDQTKMADPLANHTRPGFASYNITADDMAEIERLTDEITGNADECAMARDSVLLSAKAFYTVKKLLDAYDCNAFTMPCPDVCATRRLNEEKITFCLTHSLNNELGIPSACDYDIGALLSMQVLMNFSGGAAYMGNTAPIPYANGVAQPYRVVTAKHLEKIKNEPNLYCTFHSAPNRKLAGFDKPAAAYSIQPFAHSGFGATIRYDFSRDNGQPITMGRFSPDCKKFFIARGTVKGGGGTDVPNCTLSVIFQVKNQRDFFYKQINFGNHIPLVYGDYADDLALFAESLHLEPVFA